MGTGILPTWPRNPVAIAQQVIAIESLAPGRLRLGIGPSTEAAMRPFGVDFHSPLDQLREYLIVLRALLHEGSVDFAGDFVRARARIAPPVPTPIVSSALQPQAFELAGELSDGAITWLCPASYIEESARPALAKGARSAGRETPSIIRHVPVCLEEDPAVVREATQKQVGAYGRFQFYEAMFRRAGFPDAGDGFSQALVDEMVVYGTEAEVARRLAEIATAPDEVMAMPVIVGENVRQSISKCLNAIALATTSKVV
jgi:alkanesulfonate monooxygenase SsuD/methylene tetrahydromethanopterin reductase-like flavin-dependent oxidoreductase (luciferase family)